MHLGGQRNRHNEDFGNFANAPKNRCKKKMNWQHDVPAGSVIKGYVSECIRGPWQTADVTMDRNLFHQLRIGTGKRTQIVSKQKEKCLGL